MGVFHHVLVRVELPHGETTLSVVNMGKRSQTDVRSHPTQTRLNAQVYAGIRFVTLMNVVANLLQSDLDKSINCQVNSWVLIVTGCTRAHPLTRV